MEFNAITFVLIILVINIVYVTIATLRMITMMKGYRYLTAVVGMAETTMYVLALGLVLQNLDEIQNLIAYAIGFAMGVIVGSKIEEKMALGYIMVNVITAEKSKYLPRQLRERGYGVTDWIASGLEGDRQALQILTPRRNERRLHETIMELDPKAFIISHEPKSIYGGFLMKSVKKEKLPEKDGFNLK